MLLLFGSEWELYVMKGKKTDEALLYSWYSSTHRRLVILTGHQFLFEMFHNQEPKDKEHQYLHRCGWCIWSHRAVSNVLRNAYAAILPLQNAAL